MRKRWKMKKNWLKVTEIQYEDYLGEYAEKERIINLDRVDIIYPDLNNTEIRIGNEFLTLSNKSSKEFMQIIREGIVNDREN